MGSKRKKSEKQKDFKKAKLKVGKTKAKALNHTDTSFVAKTISLPSQSIANKKSSLTSNKIIGNKSTGSKVISQGLAVVEDVDLTRHLSLTKHHSATTRKEVLNYIEAHLPSNPSSYKNLLNSIVPLIMDQNSLVRQSLVSLLISISKKQEGIMELHARSIVLFIHSAMTHIQPDIRNDSTKFLKILVDYGPNSLIKSSWIKTLKCFCQLLNWQLNVDSKKSLSLSISTKSISSKSNSQSRLYHLEILSNFLNKGLFKFEIEKNLDDISNNDLKIYSIHALTNLYLLPTVPEPYTHLKLFIKELPSNTNPNNSSFIDLNNTSCEDIETRRKILIDFFEKPMKRGLTELLNEAGDFTKAAKNVLSILDQAEKDEQEFNSRQ